MVDNYSEDMYYELRAEFYNLEGDYEDLQEKLAEAEKYIKELESDKTDLIDQLDRKEEEIDELEWDIDDLRKDRARLDQAYEDLESTIENELNLFKTLNEHDFYVEEDEKHTAIPLLVRIVELATQLHLGKWGSNNYVDLIDLELALQDAIAERT